MTDQLTQWLAECRQRFGAPPRRFAPWVRWTRHRIPMPEWLTLKRWDRLATLFWMRQAIFRDGIVVWGHIVQANSLLFEPGPDNCPGEIVFRLDPDSHPPQNLKPIASAISALKHTQPSDPAKDRIATYLSHERMRVYGLPVPKDLVGSDGLLISTTFFTRKHLPNGMLTRELLPIIVLPSTPHVALPLPATYWPDAMIDHWTQA